MKKIFILLPLFILVASCDAPQRTRFFNTEKSPLGDTDEAVPAGATQSTSGSLGTSGSGSGSNTANTPGFESCDLTQKYHSVSTGYFGVCQSTQDEKQIKFSPSLTSQQERICLIPTYKESNGSSTYIGNPQCTLTTSNQVISGQLYKDRPGFSNHPLNGVMVMKEGLVPEYMACMQGYVNWPRNRCSGTNDSYCAYWVPSCPYGAQSNAQCDAEGKNYMAYLCNAFKSKYSNAYVDVRLK